MWRVRPVVPAAPERSTSKRKEKEKKKKKTYHQKQVLNNVTWKGTLEARSGTMHEYYTSQGGASDSVFYTSQGAEKENVFFLGVLISLVLHPILMMLSPIIVPIFVPSYKPLAASEKIEYNSRIVSSIHAIAVCFGVFPYMAVGESSSSDRLLSAEASANGGDMLYEPGPLSFYIGVLVGFLIADLVLVVANRHTMDMVRDTLFHHVLGILAFSTVGHLKVFYYYAANAIFFEFSTPLINLRWMVSKSPDRLFGKPSLFHVACGLTMTVVFFCVRVLPIPTISASMYRDWLSVGGISGYNEVIHARSDIITKLPESLRGMSGAILPIAFTFYGLSCILNIYWFYLMSTGLVKVARKQLCPKKTKAEKTKKEM